MTMGLIGGCNRHALFEWWRRFAKRSGQSLSQLWSVAPALIVTDKPLIALGHVTPHGCVDHAQVPGRCVDGVLSRNPTDTCVDAALGVPSARVISTVVIWSWEGGSPRNGMAAKAYQLSQRQSRPCAGDYKAPRQIDKCGPPRDLDPPQRVAPGSELTRWCRDHRHQAP